MRALFKLTILVAVVSASCGSARAWQVFTESSLDRGDVVLFDHGTATPIVVDANDYTVVGVAANLLADDVKRVTGQRPEVRTAAEGATQLIVAGTLGHSTLVDKLASEGRLQNLDHVEGRWEATLTQIVDKPFPGVNRALVIVGSDRRGTAYGLTQLSRAIGVSPWYWWADVPVKPQAYLGMSGDAQIDAPAVKYRGFFINDEDWGINPWAKKNFEKDLGNIGPRTYEKVFELMLRLRLNYIWPAMHACTTEFGANPENAKLADRFAIVAGSSHCEPMLCNNVHWDKKTQGPWNYLLNQKTLYDYWQSAAVARGNYEAVWTLGIRGIHDAPMATPPKDIPGKVALVQQVLKDQRGLIDRYVTKNYGPIAQCFVPYKEVLPVYDAGLQVPPDVTLVWTDDNFGYLRRLSSAAERARPGGAGFYYHISYFGGPHSYTWINTTAPALMWNEMHKAWENDARNLWMLNVGDIKPGEVGIEFLARFAWNPDKWGPDAQPIFLKQFASDYFGDAFAQPIAQLLSDYYHLGTIHKPEVMNREWAVSLSDDQASLLISGYQDLLKRADALAASMPPETRDSYKELVGFPARVLAETGLIFMADRAIQLHGSNPADEETIRHWRDDLADQVTDYNQNIAGGKWNYMMPGEVTNKSLTAWSSQVRWPWADKAAATTDSSPTTDPTRVAPAGGKWRDAASCDRQSAPPVPGSPHWVMVPGLGCSGRAMALLPVKLETNDSAQGASAPAMEFDFSTNRAGDAQAYVDFLPTFRLVPGMKLRVGIGIDRAAPTPYEVPGSSGQQDENGDLRKFAVQDNYVRLAVPLQALSTGKHTLKIQAIDPGAVVDRISLP